MLTNKVGDLIEDLKKKAQEGKMDLSSDEDLSIGVMNLIGIEEHLFFTGNKLGKSEYFDLINKVREIRVEAMKKLLPQSEGEVWCISKHLLSASMRLMEVGTKKLAKQEKGDAQRLFDQSYFLYSLFWAIRLKVVNLEDLKKEGNTNEPRSKDEAVREFVAKLIDCCGE